MTPEQAAVIEAARRWEKRDRPGKEFYRECRELGDAVRALDAAEAQPAAGGNSGRASAVLRDALDLLAAPTEPHDDPRCDCTYEPGGVSKHGCPIHAAPTEDRPAAGDDEATCPCLLHDWCGDCSDTCPCYALAVQRGQQRAEDAHPWGEAAVTDFLARDRAARAEKAAPQPEGTDECIPCGHWVKRHDGTGCRVVTGEIEGDGDVPCPCRETHGHDPQRADAAPQPAPAETEERPMIVRPCRCCGKPVELSEDDAEMYGSRRPECVACDSSPEWTL